MTTNYLLTSPLAHFLGSVMSALFLAYGSFSGFEELSLGFKRSNFHSQEDAPSTSGGLGTELGYI